MLRSRTGKIDVCIYVYNAIYCYSGLEILKYSVQSEKWPWGGVGYRGDLRDLNRPRVDWCIIEH